MKMFFAVLSAILVAAAIIFLSYKIPHDIGETRQAEKALNESIAHADAYLSAYKSVYTTPTPPEIKTLSGNSAVVVTTAVRINIPAGEVIVPRGTRLKLISEESGHFVVDYDGYPVTIPASCASRYSSRK
jgi:hypothetical protein